MFGGGSNNSPGSKAEQESKTDDKSPSPGSSPAPTGTPTPIKTAELALSGEKRSGNGCSPDRNDNGGSTDKKRRSSGVGSKASHLLASAKNSLNFSQVGRSGAEPSVQTPLQKLGKQDPALAVPQGQHNNSAGESVPGPHSTFHVGVWEDRNRKCRRTMEDTHAFLYNFLDTPVPITDAAGQKIAEKAKPAAAAAKQDMVQSDNGYFAIFDGHAGTFSADWCGKKLHIILEDTIRKNPCSPLPELLDQTFTSVDSQLEKLPLKNSGCTAAVAVLRWEDRVPSERSATGSQALGPAAAAGVADGPAPAHDKVDEVDESPQSSKPSEKAKISAGATSEASASWSKPALAKLQGSARRQRVLYTANVGDARIILCRNGKALRLSYDHKGSDENEGKRIANAGGLILNNRVNGVLAVTRALGDSYMKDLVTGHPYTTETVVQPNSDEFFIIACDGLWDVCTDQEAVDLVRNIQDPVAAAKVLVDHALEQLSTDNLSCMIVRFDKEALSQKQHGKHASNNSNDASAKVSEAEKIVNDTKQKIAEGSNPALGVSASNSGRGQEPIPAGNEGFAPTSLDGMLEEEPAEMTENDSPEVTPGAERVALNLHLPKDASAS